MTQKLVTVFGGSGFVGTHVVRALVKDGWRVRVAMRRPHIGQDLKVMGDVGQVQLVQANIRFPLSVARALDGADAAVNLVGVLFEAGRQNFKSLHETGARVVAEACRDAGITDLVQMSSLGADPEAGSEYARTKAAGEAAARAAVPDTVFLRPSVIFGPEDDFFNKFADMARMAPALPLIGMGKTRFQPVYVGDVAEAVVKVLGGASRGKTYELGGPGTYSFKELLQFILETIDRKRFLAPLPFFAASGLGLAGEMAGMLPFVSPFLTRDQVENLKVDNVVSGHLPGLPELDIEGETIESRVPPYLERFKKYGQFHEPEPV